MDQPNTQNVRIYQKPGRITAASLEAADQLLLLLPERPTNSLWNSLPGGARLQTLLSRSDKQATPVFTSRLHNKKQTFVVTCCVPKSANQFEQLTQARQLVATLGAEKVGSVAIVALGVSGKTQQRYVKNVLAAVLAAAFVLPSFSAKAKSQAIKSVRILGLSDPLDTSRIEAEAAGNNLARWLTTMPPNKLDAKDYAAFVKNLAATNGWRFTKYDTKALTKLGAGAFLAVAQGNEDNSASIVRLQYRPNKKSTRPDLSLVGKGIIFDTGGTNLKPFQSMLDMHGDMQGSGVALGSLFAISKLQLPVAVDCWLALTENRTGPRAYKSQDVVTAANGKTIQTVHTDAEGRMALADTLVLASREKPRLIIDYATLTGTCVSALTSRYSGVFTNRATLHPKLKRTGRHSGERVWPFPIGKEFLDDLKSDTADLLQCSPKNDGDHMLAASFLAEFVENDTPWIHMDLSASDNDGGLAHVPSKFTGFGVRYTLSVVLDDDLYRDSLSK